MDFWIFLNKVISSFGINFGFFDFSFAGIPVSILGILFIAFIGWRLIQLRPINSRDNPLIELGDYLVEMVVKKNSKLIDKRALDFRQDLDTDTALIGQIDEQGKKIEIHGWWFDLESGDLWSWVNNEKNFKKGDKIILAAFGAGLTWGAAYLTWAYN